MPSAYYPRTAIADATDWGGVSDDEPVVDGQILIWNNTLEKYEQSPQMRYNEGLDTLQLLCNVDIDENMVIDGTLDVTGDIEAINVNLTGGLDISTSGGVNPIFNISNNAIDYFSISEAGIITFDNTSVTDEIISILNGTDTGVVGFDSVITGEFRVGSQTVAGCRFGNGFTAADSHLFTDPNNIKLILANTEFIVIDEVIKFQASGLSSAGNVVFIATNAQINNVIEFWDNSATTLAYFDKVSRFGTVAVNEPTAAIGLGADDGNGDPLVTVSGSDQNGLITLNTGQDPATSETVLTFTFTTAWAGAPKTVILYPANAAAMALGANQPYVNSNSISITQFLLTANDSVALDADAEYKWYYLVIG